MSKILKLVGLESYVNPLTESICIKKGQSIKVSDKVAEKMLAGARTNSEGDSVSYWQESNDSSFIHDFSRNEIAQPKGAKPLPKLSDEDEGDDEGDAVVVAPVAAKSVQRKRT